MFHINWIDINTCKRQINFSIRLNLKVSFYFTKISPEFYEQLFCTKGFEQLFCTYSLGWYFFGKRKLEQKLLVKCWWIWLLVPIHDTVPAAKWDHQHKSDNNNRNITLYGCFYVPFGYNGTGNIWFYYPWSN